MTDVTTAEQAISTACAALTAAGIAHKLGSYGEILAGGVTVRARGKRLGFTSVYDYQAWQVRCGIIGWRTRTVRNPAGLVAAVRDALAELAREAEDRRLTVEAREAAAVRADATVKLARPLLDALPGSVCSMSGDACVVSAGPISAAVAPDGSVRIAMPCSSVAQALAVLGAWRREVGE